MAENDEEPRFADEELDRPRAESAALPEIGFSDAELAEFSAPPDRTRDDPECDREPPHRFPHHDMTRFVEEIALRSPKVRRQDDGPAEAARVVRVAFVGMRAQLVRHQAGPYMVLDGPANGDRPAQVQLVLRREAHPTALGREHRDGPQAVHREEASVAALPRRLDARSAAPAHREVVAADVPH